MPYFDMYVSSQSCGFRKPNPEGVHQISEHFGADEKQFIFVGDEPKDTKRRRMWAAVQFSSTGRAGGWKSGRTTR